MAIVFLESAGKHGFTEDDVIHAMTYKRLVKKQFDSSRTVMKADPTLWIGPACDGRLIEVMTYIDPPRDVVVFHCMQLRGKFSWIMEGEER
ncbi:hypothetical protein [Bifidobacterium crudilactis]|jgi:hypothetical protein|uniref:hypothetical protein n=1 Tax=Bifidobacterium crudilactis TaxID=327277 RepID=UPI0005585132|nr:hypothetical protein [Bifidobacterium crudilactis]MCI2149165.1 hypothetical protein [Bifidobacterium crudilactis]MCI2158047.1 hypothetical protein [Bifidobacterium crudilactis]